MQIARILLPLGSRGTSAASVDVAYTVADRFSARVEGLHPCVPPLDRLRVSDEAAAPMRLQKLLEDARKQATAEQEAAQAAFRAAADRYRKVASDFRVVEADISAAVGARGRVADVAVVPARREGESPFWAEVRESALFNTGRPVIVAPDAQIEPAFGETVVIAWKTGVEAARAVTAAKPFLAKAKRVRVVTVGEEGVDERALADASEYLTLLNLKVESKMLPKSKDSAASLLLEEVGATKDALLVMGAYSHWRWREWAFGGVTESMLKECPVPVLMMH